MRALPASVLGPARLVEVWNLAYAGYFVPMSWGVEQLERHVLAGSVDLDRSLVWCADDEPIALSLLGVRPSSTGEHGWIGGFGVVPAHRGRGLSVGLMREHLEHLRSVGPRRVQLEVLTQNWAVRSYERAGFTTTRRLTVLRGELLRTGAGSSARWVTLDQLPDLAGQLDRLHTAYPAAWTREPAAVLVAGADLECLAVGPVDDLDAVALIGGGPGPVRIVEAAAHDADAARELVAGLSLARPGQPCALVNEPDGSPLVGAFRHAGIEEAMAQHEMHWQA